MELIRLPDMLNWIREMPWFLFFPFAMFVSLIGSIVITELIMKWLDLAFGYKEP